MKRQMILKTPLGLMRLTADDRGLQALDFRVKGKVTKTDVFFRPIGKALEDYFRKRKPLPRWAASDLGGTAFQRRVWKALMDIPFGKTRNYGEVAKSIGAPGAARAVGSACGANPLPIFIPCHRVLAAGGKLGGYSGGLDIKKKLLRLEGVPSKDRRSRNNWSRW